MSLVPPRLRTLPESVHHVVRGNFDEIKATLKDWASQLTLNGNAHAVTRGNPHQTQHAELVNVFTADPSASDTYPGKHVTNEQTKKWEDHADATGNPHSTAHSELTDDEPERHVDWTKIAANSVTLDAGTTPSSLVADLQTFADGNVYHIDEAAATPGIDLKVDFVSVTDFHRVQIVGMYSGTITAHSVSIQLYNWSTAAWDTFNSHLSDENTMVNRSFFVPDPTDYIGTGGSAGQVRVRFNHTVTGNSAHDLDIDVVALYP